MHVELKIIYVSIQIALVQLMVHM